MVPDKAVTTSHMIALRGVMLEVVTCAVTVGQQVLAQRPQKHSTLGMFSWSARCFLTLLAGADCVQARCA